jgi:hypothetical protein
MKYSLYGCESCSDGTFIAFEKTLELLANPSGANRGLQLLD